MSEHGTWRGVVSEASPRLRKIKDHQIRRDPWPDFEAFRAQDYTPELRRAAAVQWAGRARAEYGSIHQFTQVAHALCEARAPIDLHGALARLITDEVRHAELCARMAEAICPDAAQRESAIFRWPVPDTPWPRPKLPADETTILGWAACAVLVACCLGETLSEPMLDALIVVTTDPVPEAVARQIGRDEHLHAAFGWETLGWLLPRLDDRGRDQVQARLGRALAGFQSTTACGIPVEEVAHRSIEIVRDEARPNLGTLTDLQYAMIFYATLERDIFPPLRALGLDPDLAWRQPRPA